MVEREYQHQKTADGKVNPHYVDLLEEDKAISGQKFVCVSFVSPENTLKRRDLFMFESFLKDYDFSKSMEKFSQFLNFLSYKYNLNFETLMSDMQEFVKSEKDDLKTTDIYDSYKTFLDNHENELDDEFNKQNNFQTSVRGLKVRGSYSTQEEAELRCKLLREVDPNHNVYVGPVGVWMPWEPEAYKTGRVEYLEDELNQLMHEKNLNEAKAKQEFEKRIQDTKRKAIEENVKLARESGNKLTQRLDKEGNLVGVNNTIENDLKELDDTSSESIKKALFEGDNIVRKNKD
tara:strand:+ start:9701 stop:10570 length:870 start_codon:yes stop_codon:yes gene_type:complete